MEFVNCIICNSKDNFKLIESVCDRFKKQDSYNILECSCGMVMLNPRPNISDIAKHYESTDYQPHYKKNNLLNLLYRIAQFINNNSKAYICSLFFASTPLCLYNSFLDSRITKLFPAALTSLSFLILAVA